MQDTYSISTCERQNILLFGQEHVVCYVLSSPREKGFRAFSAPDKKG